MKTLYVVNFGVHFDHAIDAIFDTKELAQKYIAEFYNGDEFGRKDMIISEWELNPNKANIENGEKPYTVTMDKEGNVEVELASASPLFNHTKYSFYYDKDLMVCEFFAKDEAHAIKIANERRLKHIDEDSWGKKSKR